MDRGVGLFVAEIFGDSDARRFQQQIYECLDAFNFSKFFDPPRPRSMRMSSLDIQFDDALVGRERDVIAHDSISCLGRNERSEFGPLALGCVGRNT